MTPMRWSDRLGMHRVSQRDRRAIRMGFLILVPVLLWAGAYRPYRRAWDDTRDRLETERSLLAREQALIDAAESLPEVARDAGIEADLVRRRMVDAPNATLAEAELTNELERLAIESRVLLEEMRSIEPPRGQERPAGIQPIRLAVRGQSDLNGVSALLQRVEESRLLIRVEELSIQPVTQRPGGNQRGRNQEEVGAPTPTGIIEFALIVEAYAAIGPVVAGDAPKEVGT